MFECSAKLLELHLIVEDVRARVPGDRAVDGGVLEVTGFVGGENGQRGGQ